MNETSKVLSAPYLPFKTFLTALDSLHGHGVPNIIDRSVFRSFSGAAQSQVISSFLFLGLIDENHVPTEVMHRLVTETDDRKRILKTILEEKFSNLFAADLTRLSPSQFESLFSTEVYGVSGDTRKKARTFFFGALDFTGVAYSKLLTQRTRSPRKRTPRNNDSAKEKAEDVATPTSTHRPIAASSEGASTVRGDAIKTIRLVDSDKTVWIGSDATMFEIKPGKDLDFVLALINLFNDYESSASAENNN